MKIKLKTLSLASILTVITSISFAADLEEGKSMYEEDCVKCHDSSVFTRKETKVKDIDGLKAQVHRCVGATEASWFEEDEENVVAYLSHEFYKFEKIQKKQIN